MRVLAIESSADETAAAIVEDGYKLLASEVASSLDLHQIYGGIVPEVAARSHLEVMIPTIEAALDSAGADWGSIDAVAVTQGPGLIGSLLIGIMTARTLALTKKKPLYRLSHVEAHVYANFITDTSLPGYRLPARAPEFPLLALIVSGGHTQLALFRDHGDYKILGRTLDDAVGEAFDKVAKIIGLPYPGGPSVEKMALTGDPQAIKLPVSRLDNPYDFSYSGLKTAFLRAAQALAGQDYTFPSSGLAGRLNSHQKADLAASFQTAAFSPLLQASLKAIEAHHPKSFVLAGGVAASPILRATLAALPLEVIYPDPKLCTDNAAMVAALAFYKASIGRPADPYSLSPAPNLTM